MKELNCDMYVIMYVILEQIVLPPTSHKLKRDHGQQRVGN